MKKDKTKYVNILLFSAYINAVLCYLVQFVWQVYWDDLSVWLTIGRRIASGEIPYKDIFDNKGPVLLFFYAFGILLGHNTAVMVYVLFIIWSLLTVFILYKAARMIMTPFWAAFCCLIMSLPQFLLFVGGVGGYSESITLLFQGIGALCYFHIQRSKSKIRLYSFLFGLSMSCAFLTRPNLIGLWLTTGVCWLVEDIRKKNIRYFLTKILWAVIGFLSVALIFVIYFWSHNALYDFYDGLIGYNFFEYVGERSAGFKLANIIKLIKANPLLQLVQSPLICSGIVLCMVMTVLFVSDEISKNRIKTFIVDMKFVIVWGIVELFLMSLSGFTFPHYYIPLLIPLSLFSGNFFQAMDNKTSDNKLKIVSKAVLVFIILCIPTLYNLRAANDMRYWSRDGINKTIDFIKNNTEESDTIYSNTLAAYFAVFVTNRNTYSKYNIVQRWNNTKNEIFGDVENGYKMPKLIIFLARNDLFAQVDENLVSKYYTKTQIDDFVYYLRSD